MKKILLMFSLVLFLLLPSIALADIATPSVNTFYFQDGKKEYGKPLTFSIEAYGYNVSPPDFTIKEEGTYTPEKVGSWGNYSCQSYGCAFMGYNYLSLKYAHIDYYVFKITSDEGYFEVKKTDIDFEKNCDSTFEQYEQYNCSTTVNLADAYITPYRGAITPSDPDEKTIAEKEKAENENIPLNPIPENNNIDNNTNKNKTMAYQVMFLIALAATIVIEVIILLALLKLLPKKEKEVKGVGNIIVAGILASGLTLPYLWFVMPRFVASYNWNIVISELLIVVAEALIYSYLLKIKIGRALFISLVCNAVSFLIGFWLLPLIL